ncbi:uncharacterized protein F5Z01DRAFT_647920 [Emericellopsis atlantica]|uniref:DUF7587 domain-containing protein n=1 Tax=Emericellopsis atlantica TaxID=2614577 RepID=A0A9P7ZRX7_9HYPO|nr:uncharacterized protein F5Z01DRAFT_647920 [Emericellopsis atlantica]KAG9257184.1 hypothetical protein F5Z01DRAFT_647920 [Emericellopsis atlantica]
MAEDIPSLVDSIKGLRLAHGTTVLPCADSDRASSHQIILVDALRALIQSAEATNTHAREVLPLAKASPTLSSQDIAQLSSLRTRANALASITKTFSDACERFFVASITSLAVQETLARKMLSHFDDKVKSIARDVLNSAGDDTNVLREILEMCYSQSLHTSGTLHSDNYFIPLGEASLEWPYDPDFESEQYYEHEDRAADDGYAAAFRLRCERKSESERKQREEWIRFWVSALGNCPDGPTLFYPAAGQCRLADVPRYLFRAFDDASLGRSNKNVVASMESISTESLGSKRDLLSRPRERATRMLHKHLTNSCFGGEDTDNLMSWSSSLLFVLQYAIWRRRHFNSDPSDVKICMVDTRKFPHGQFARDKSLLREYSKAPKLDEEIKGFFDFRLGKPDYDNGEYISQGILHHTGRSSVVSLAQLTGAGLHDLYPEFANLEAMKLWTNRVKELRSIWSSEHTTTQSEIRIASEIGRVCFHGGNVPEGALLLLSFKNRKLRATTTTTAEVQDHRTELDELGPTEVQRYVKIARTMKLKAQGDSGALGWLASNDTSLLEMVFECT